MPAVFEGEDAEASRKIQREEVLTSAYPAAGEVAVRVQPRLAGECAPGVVEIEQIVNVAFWASLRREENVTPKISLAYATPADVKEALVFARPVLLAAEPLTRLGPAVERPGIHLCVARIDGELCVWGAARVLPRLCFVLEVVTAGLLVIKQSRGDESGKFINVAVLQGDEVKVVDAAVREAKGAENVLMRLAVSMRAHGRGGSLLVVPAGSEAWRESILEPIGYSVSPVFGVLRDLVDEEAGIRLTPGWQEALHHAVEAIAGLTAVDGATVMTDRYEVLGFGAKIVRPTGRERVERVMVTEPIEGFVRWAADVSHLGGTRHLSAAQFAHDQREAVAMVASQDGRFTVFGWWTSVGMVRANRIEALLL